MHIKQPKYWISEDYCRGNHKTNNWNYLKWSKKRSNGLFSILGEKLCYWQEGDGVTKHFWTATLKCWSKFCIIRGFSTEPGSVILFYPNSNTILLETKQWPNTHKQSVATYACHKHLPPFIESKNLKLLPIIILVLLYISRSSTDTISCSCTTTFSGCPCPPTERLRMGVMIVIAVLAVYLQRLSWALWWHYGSNPAPFIHRTI